MQVEIPIQAPAAAVAAEGTEPSPKRARLRAGVLRAQFCCVTGCRSCAWERWVGWKTNGTGCFTLEQALPLLLRDALVRRAMSCVELVMREPRDVVLRHLEEQALQDDAWAAAVAAAESGDVNIEDEASVSDWAAAVAADLRRARYSTQPSSPAPAIPATQEQIDDLLCGDQTRAPGAGAEELACC